MFTGVEETRSIPLKALEIRHWGGGVCKMNSSVVVSVWSIALTTCSMESLYNYAKDYSLKNAKSVTVEAI